MIDFTDIFDVYSGSNCCGDAGNRLFGVRDAAQQSHGQLGHSNTNDDDEDGVHIDESNKM
jgi:hypothetical protein